MKVNELVDMPANIGRNERIISLVGGGYLLYKALARDKSLLKSLAAGYLLFRGSTGYCPLNQAMGIKEVELTNDVNVKTSVTVNKPREQVYKFWRNLENLPRFMQHIHSITSIDEKTTEWQMKMPGGLGIITWRSEISEDIPYEFISWISLPNSTIENVGSIHFEDSGRFGTEIHVDITYRAPLGTPGKRLAKMLNPLLKTMIKQDIMDFKRVIETGEVPVAAEHNHAGL